MTLSVIRPETGEEFKQNSSNRIIITGADIRRDSSAREISTIKFANI
jgi:hypothetical protein